MFACVHLDSMLWWQMAGAWWQMAGARGYLVASWTAGRRWRVFEPRSPNMTFHGKLQNRVQGGHRLGLIPSDNKSKKPYEESSYKENKFGVKWHLAHRIQLRTKQKNKFIYILYVIINYIYDTFYSVLQHNIHLLNITQPSSHWLIPFVFSNWDREPWARAHGPRSEAMISYQGWCGRPGGGSGGQSVMCTPSVDRYF